ncbi:short-chain fatty acyl-CoA regulator family protein [Streptomyces broussonetiae]|uniref:short-chain fatty acyl-CoA regulator family protein n=1 Tax=Streptomyces broussonetiae TaxID=2686304 RepID=UPI0035E14822
MTGALTARPAEAPGTRHPSGRRAWRPDAPLRREKPQPPSVLATRQSATGFRFSRAGGTCPLWSVYDTASRAPARPSAAHRPEPQHVCPVPVEDGGGSR